jgi:hypothetical protein
MYEIEATVTKATPSELELTADWPLAWWHVEGSSELGCTLEAGEVLPALREPVKRGAFAYSRELHPELERGERVIVRCYLKGEARYR